LYRQLGIADAVVEQGVRVPALNLWVEGERAARVPLQRLGEGMSPYPFPVVHPQDAHERLLIERLDAARVRVERRTELLAFEQGDARVRATLGHPDGSEEICEFLYLAGCDGASSTVREGLGIGFPGGTYEGLFYVADVEASGRAMDGELHIDIEDADFALLFPMRGEGRARLVGNVLHVRGRDEGGLTFDDVRGRAIGHLKLNIRDVNWFSTYQVHHRVAHSFRDRRVFLLGDAAHIHSPAGGQGMNTGIGDAVNLAWKLAAVLDGGAPAGLLDTYESERIGFARRLVATTDRVFTIVTKQGLLARFVRTVIAPFVVPLAFRLPSLRQFLFRTVSQIGIEYRESSLSEGRAGAVTGGDRLPWVPMAPGGDNFAPLGSLAWQVHIYGEARDDATELCATLGLPLNRFTWRPEMRQAGLEAGALYLVRPDGYVALADPPADPRRLHRYLEERGLFGCGVGV
jgi:2-polyprenyl-6-methoxyphenol hydroxylase-like FAD-dependent oxidoreductase